MLKNKLIKLTIERYVSEVSKSLIYTIKNNKKVLVISGMGEGKTNFLTNQLKEHAEEAGVNLLAVEPVKLLIEQIDIKTKHQWGLYYSDKKDDISKHPYMVATVDNSLNVANQWEKDKKYFYASIDEAHEEEFSRDYREAFKNISKLADNPYCLGVVYFTATGEDLKEHFSDQFDKIVEISKADTIKDEEGKEVPNPHKKAFAKATYINIGKWNIENVQAYRNKIRETHQAPLLCKWDNIDAIRDMEINTNVTNKHTENKTEFYSLTTKKIRYNTEKENEASRAKELNFRERLKKYERIEGNVDIWHSSVLNCGTEVNNDPSTIQWNIINNKSFVESNEVQLLGRSRNGVKEYHLLVNEATDKAKEKTLRGYKEIYTDLKNIAYEYKKFFTKLINIAPHMEDDHIKEAKKKVGIDVVETEEGIFFEVDEIELKAEAIKREQQQLLAHPKELRDRLEARYGHILGEIKVIYTSVEDEHKNAEVLEAMEESEKAKEEKVDNLLKKLNKELPIYFKELSNILDNDKFSFLTDEEREFKKVIIGLRQYAPALADLEKKFAKIEVPSNLFWEYCTRKTIKELKETLEAEGKVYYNRLFTEGEATRRIFKNLSYGTKKTHKEALRQYKHLEYFEKVKIKNGDNVTKRHFKDLILINAEVGIPKYIKFTETLKDSTISKGEKEKALNKLIKDEINYLRLIFKTTTTIKNKKEYIRFSSIRFDIADKTE